jgi:hypothetical protein
MKKIIYSLMLGFLVLSFSACQPNVLDEHDLGGTLIANGDISFTVAPTDKQNEYTFTNTSKEQPKNVQLFWSFGDGKVVAAYDTAKKAYTPVKKQYKKAGSYTVSLIGFTKGGQTAASTTFTVAQDLQAFMWPGFDYTSSVNLFKTASYTNGFYYAPGWGQIANPTITPTGNQKFNLVFGSATSAQWQNQVSFTTNIPISAGKTYDFSVCLQSSTDIPAATVKVQKDGDDNTSLLLRDHNVSLTADTKKVVSGSALAGFDGNLKIVFDFGGNPANTNLEISNIYISEHQAANVAPLDYDLAGNVWKAVDTKKDYSMGFWWADANWSQIGNPGFDQTGSVYTITSKSSTAAEWQAQNTFNTNSLAIGADALFDFSCVVMATKDSPCIIKLCPQETNGDTNYAFEVHAIQLKANEIKVIRFNDQKLKNSASTAKAKLIFDFGGCQDATDFSITGITLIKK